MTRTRTMMLAVGTVTAVAGAVLIPGSAGAATGAKNIPVVTANLGKSVTLSTTHLRSGRVTFDVHSRAEHTLQIASLHKGYTLAQANQDIGAGFGGSAAAIRRVDANVDFRGGSQAKAHHPSRLTIYLPAGNYLAVDFDNGSARAFTVSGSVVNRKTVKDNSRITMLTYGFDTSPRIHRRGVMRLSNNSDQPHFIVIQHVKRSTTYAQVKKALANDNGSKPSFALKAETDSGVLSNTRAQLFTYDLPAGKYVIACFWPDDETGMQHAAMGMFKIITLY